MSGEYRENNWQVIETAVGPVTVIARGGKKIEVRCRVRHPTATTEYEARIRESEWWVDTDFRKIGSDSSFTSRHAGGWRKIKSTIKTVVLPAAKRWVEEHPEFLGQAELRRLLKNVVYHEQQYQEALKVSVRQLAMAHQAEEEAKKSPWYGTLAETSEPVVLPEQAIAVG